MHAITDLTTLVRKSKGDVPPPLAGPSTTVVGDALYLFGGRLGTQRRMLADTYQFNIPTVTWTRLSQPDNHTPKARYFHSADVWNGHIVVFGGMTDSTDTPSPNGLAVLNDVHLFSVAQGRWLPPVSFPPASPDLVPRARYAHLSAVSGDRLYVIGGHDMSNVWLDDVHVYDLRRGAWVARLDYPRHCGTYRSVAVSSPLKVVEPAPGSVDPERKGFGREQGKNVTDPSQLQHLSYSTVPTADEPSSIYLYSNHNFTDVKRELEVIQPTPLSPDAPLTHTDQTQLFPTTPHALPPGLRFPMGAQLGHHLLLCGTYLAHTYQSFSLWALDLRPGHFTWQRIDCGAALAVGSWARGALWSDSAQFLIFGNRAGNLVEDYNRRLLTWTHVAYVDLEASGIYQPPKLALGLRESELGLAALEEELMADFEVVCDDGRSVRCSRRALDERWPWFREQRRAFLSRAAAALEAKPEQIDPSYPIELPSDLSVNSLTDVPSVQGPAFSGGPPLPRADPRLTPRQLLLPSPYPIALALLQYFYTYSLLTPLQHAPPVLSALLILSSTYELPHLQSLVRHAMHQKLTLSNSVSVYEVATVCDCQSLQIRALKVVMSKPGSGVRGPRSRPDRSGGGGGGGGGGPGTDGDADKERDEREMERARPRGMSNARDLKIPSEPTTGADGSGTSTAPEPTEAPPARPPRSKERDSRRVSVASLTEDLAPPEPILTPPHGLSMLAPAVAPVPGLRRANSDRISRRHVSNGSVNLDRPGRRPMSSGSGSTRSSMSGSISTPHDSTGTLPLIPETDGAEQQGKKPLRVEVGLATWLLAHTSPALHSAPSTPALTSADSSPTRSASSVSTPSTPTAPKTPKTSASGVPIPPLPSFLAKLASPLTTRPSRSKSVKLTRAPDEQTRLAGLGADSRRRAAKVKREEEADERLRLRAIETVNMREIIRLAGSRPQERRLQLSLAPNLGGL